MKSFLLSVFIFSALSGFTQSSYVAGSAIFLDSVSPTEDISATAIQSFNKMFSNVESAKWHSIEDGSTVKFRQDNISYHVFYDRRGKWKATIAYLPVDKLPRWLSSRVKSDFKKFSIFFAQHVRTRVGNTYIIKIEKGNDWKCIRLSPEATEILGEYVRN